MAHTEIVQQALLKTKERVTSNGCPELSFSLIESQLNYLRKVLSGKRPFSLRTARIKLGHFSQIFAGQDPGYAQLLAESQKIADSLPRHS